MPAAVRINVLGASGSGASTLGRHLATVLEIPHVDSDDYYHVPTDPPFQIARSPRERCESIMSDLARHESWILSGGVAGWDPEPQLAFTLFVFLVVPTEVRLRRLRERESARFGSRIIDGGDMAETHREFLHWASHYDAGDMEGKSLPRHLAYLSQQTCPVLRIDGELSTQRIVDDVIGFLSDPQFPSS